MLISLPAGEGNGVLLAYRARMIDAGITPATINRRLAAIRSALKLARTLGLTAWAPEIRGLKVEAYRDTTGPGLPGTRAMLAKARVQMPVKAARDVALIRLMFDLGLRRGEVTGLDLEDFEAKERRLWIRGKGRTQKEARTFRSPPLRPCPPGSTHARTPSHQRRQPCLLALLGECAVSASPAVDCTMSSPSWAPPSASGRVHMDCAMPASRLPLMPTTATCGPCSCMPATPIRRRPCATTTTARTWLAGWLPAWRTYSEGSGYGQDSEEGG